MDFRRRINILIISILCLAAGIYLYARFIDSVSPRAATNFNLSRSEIINAARSYLDTHGFDIDRLYFETVYTYNLPINLYFQSMMSLSDANQVMREEEKPFSYWTVNAYDRSLPRWVGKEEFQVFIMTDGSVAGFNRVLQATAAGKTLQEDEALEISLQYLGGHSIDLDGFYLQRSSSNRLENRTDWEFIWMNENGIYSTEETIRIRIQGDEVGVYNWRVQPPKDFIDLFYQRQTAFQFATIVTYTAVFLLFFFVVFTFLKRYHEGEVGVNTALMVLIGVYAISFLDYVNVFYVLGADFQFGAMNMFNTRIVMFAIVVLIIMPFLLVMTFAGWSVGESFARSLWSYKLNSFDALLQRKFFAYPLGLSIVQGYGLGLLGFGVLLAITAYGISMFDLGAVAISHSGIGESFIPGLKPIIEALWVAALCEIVFRLFILSYVKARFRKTFPAVIISLIIWSFVGFAVWTMVTVLDPLPVMFIMMLLFGAWFTFLFLRYDLVTSMTANFLTIALAIAVPLFFAEGQYFTNHAYLFSIFMFIPFVVAAGGLLWGKGFSYTPETIPPHIKRISQRERMAKELEIARSVQMSLLPKDTPKIPGFDIAGICIPAQEVGGDYFDYVLFNNGNIGIAIGDVSGKGVPAAIYMTLTKGVLQSHAEEDNSPREVLVKVNNQLYGTIERNSFVSMVYAVLDVKRKTMRYARAGHNPVILAHLDTDASSVLIPKGMALGLDRGSLFEQSLEENKINLKSGDLLTFYTDGFTEARRSVVHEFGQEEFIRLITKYRSLSARQIITNSISDIKKFRGEYPQHDDMTIVVVKVL